jgi:hypothetical protein
MARRLIASGRSRTLRLAAAVAGTFVLLSGVPVEGVAAAGQSRNLSAGALADAAADYVSRYQDALAFVLADETTVQRVVARYASTLPDYTETRVTRSEIFLTYLAAEEHWTTVRDVAEVDGVAVADREDLASLIVREDVRSLARRLFAANARYNIGHVVRNFNDPLLALLPFSRAHRSRFRFDVAAVDRSRPGLVLATLRFRERDRPTLVRRTNGSPVYSSGEITMDASTGVIRRTRLVVDDDDVEAELSTEFVPEDRLGLWVPSLFVERYRASRGGRADLTTCESRYTNYRRFEAKGRLLEVAAPR